MSKHHNKFYMIFVKTTFLSPQSDIIDRLWENGCGVDSGYPELLLFAVTTKKKRIEDFFMLHKKEMFVVQKMGADEARECYGRMSTADHYYYQENDFSRLKDEREYTAHLSPYWLNYHNIQLGYIRNGVADIAHVDVCITDDEYDIVSSRQSMENEDCYGVYDNQKFMNYLIDNVFSKKVVKALKAIHYKELQEYATHIYGPIGSPIPKTVEYNEYADLMALYHEVLIGGEDGLFVI